MKKYLFFIIILLINQAMAFDIWLKPQVGYNFNQDKNLQKYFNNNGFFSTGISLDIIYGNKYGIFANFNRINFTAKETISSIVYKNKIVGTWSTFGIFRQFNLNDLPIFAKIKVGRSYHYNNYTNIFDDEFFHGIFLGTEIGYKINQNFQVGIFTHYSNAKFKIDDYRNSTSSRHNQYLAGREITDPHFIIGANLAVKVW